MHIAAFDPTTEQHSVSVLHQVDELVPRSLYDGICRLCLIADPGSSVKVVTEIPAPDDADVVEFESLDVVHAANLVDPVRIRRPQTRRWNPWSKSPVTWLGVPRATIVSNNHVFDKRAIGEGFRPFPTKPCSDAGRKPLLS